MLTPYKSLALDVLLPYEFFFNREYLFNYFFVLKNADCFIRYYTWFIYVLWPSKIFKLASSSDWCRAAILKAPVKDSTNQMDRVNFGRRGPEKYKRKWANDCCADIEREREIFYFGKKYKRVKRVGVFRVKIPTRPCARIRQCFANIFFFLLNAPPLDVWNLSPTFINASQSSL